MSSNGSGELIAGLFSSFPDMEQIGVVTGNNALVQYDGFG